MNVLTRINAICPYFTMYPLEFPLNVLKEYGVEENLVVDPFCGRGTTSLAARMTGLSTVAVDRNPLAVVVTQAKLADVSSSDLKSAFRELVARLDFPEDYSIAKEQAKALTEQHEFWQLAFAPNTLIKLLHLRRVLSETPDDQVSAPLRAVIAGALHGPLQKSKHSYLSNQAPRTFSPKPDYAVRYWKTRSMKPPGIDFETVISERIDRYFSELPPCRPYRVVRADSRYANWEELTGGKLIDLVITSPPYFGMVSYSSDQWLRLWLLGGSPSVDYSSRYDFSHTNTTAFAADLRKVWSNLRKQSNENARMVVRMGSIPSRPSDPEFILEESLHDTGWRIVAVRDAGDPRHGKRQHDHFGRADSAPAREIDAHCIAN